MSCGSAGNCSAGGYYTDGSGHQQAFVAGETNGIWGKAKQVPGTAALNAGGAAEITSGVVRRGGQLQRRRVLPDGSGHQQAFVAGETNGTWGKAEEVPGTAAPTRAGAPSRRGVVRWAGNCSAGGYYQTAPAISQVFVAGETNGTWGNAKEVPGTAALNVGGEAAINSVSCARRATAAPAGLHRRPLPPPGVRRRRGERRLGHRAGGPRHRGPQQGRGRRDLLGVVRHGGQLQRQAGTTGRLRPQQAFVVNETSPAAGRWS